MTTKFKIIAGFGILIVLLAGLAIFGFVSLDTISEKFIVYTRQARLDTISSDMATDVGNARAAVRRFIQDADPKALEDALSKIDHFQQLCVEAVNITRIEERKKAFDSLRQSGMRLKTYVEQVRIAVLNVKKLYNEDARPTYRGMISQIDTMAQTAYDVNNLKALFLINGIMESMAHTMSSLGRFSESYSEDSANGALESISGMREILDTLALELRTDQGRVAYKNLQDARNNLLRCVNVLKEEAGKAMVATGALVEATLEIDKTSNALSDRLARDAQEAADQLLQLNDVTKTSMLVISSVGVVCGIALALLIVFNFAGTLSKMAFFSEAVADGELNAQLAISEKGEIGMMATSLRAIPATLNRMLEEYKRMEKEISCGILTTAGKSVDFKGEFATLVSGTNHIIERLRTVIDNIPSPVVLMNNEAKFQYMNAVAQEVAGSDFRGKSCMQVFRRDDDGTAGDALQKVFQTKQRATAETQAHPKGQTLDISYTVIPLLDEKKELVSVIQLITDLTAIRTQQRTMREVTDQAAEISNRMAAASEELSAQVEQVARGAEMQRERVESTASAMNEMNSTVLEVARSAGQASEQSESTRGKAEGGAELVNKVVRAINNINSVATTLQGNMQELGTKAESIGGVMNVISDIADQTNLLALNAAIEAARAGEAGRGFAVVADEVRKLAEKTMSATQEVGSNITAIQQSAQQNIEEVGTAVKSIGEATGLANSSGDALKEIVNLAAANSAVVTSIATAAEQQSATSEEINRSVDEINRITNETADGMVQSSAAVQELSQMAQELNTVMAKLK